MKHAISIDWLSLYGRLGKSIGGYFSASDGLPQVVGYTYEQLPYGSRQYAEIWCVYLYKEKIAEVQRAPYSSALDRHGCIVKFDNRLLYDDTCWGVITEFLYVHNIEVQSVSRVDICADFNRFETYEVVDMIRDFLSMELRHVGRGNGAAYFEHRGKVDKHTRINDYDMQYSGLSFGSHSSDIRVYLYNKTKELAEVKDKPHISQMWDKVGLLNSRKNPVWRLEVSISGKGVKFKDNATGEIVTITIAALKDDDRVAILYHTFISHYFQFVRNRKGIKNITREPRIDLFGDTPPIIDRRTLRALSGGNLSERIAIRKLWQMSEEYRKMDNDADRNRTQQLASDLAHATNLADWLREKSREWPAKKRKM